MKHIGLIFFLLFSTRTAYCVSDQKGLSEAEKSGHLAFVWRCFQDFQKIKIGSTRKQVEQLLEGENGGSGDSSFERYVHPLCPYFKVDIQYEPLKTDAPDETYFKMEVKTISRPFLGLWIGD